MRPRVEIVIDELVLHGFPPAERYAIGDSLSQELEQLVLEQGYLPQEGMDIPMHRAAPIKLPANPKPDMVGSQVAQAVFGGLKQ